MREFFGSLTCEIAEKFLLAFVERMSKGKDSEMEDAQNTLKVLIEKAQKLKIDLSKVPAIQKRKSFFQVPRKVKLCVSLLVLLIAYAKFGDLIASDKCLIAMPKDLDKVFRKPDDCSFCRGISSGLRISNIQPEEFEEKFAYNGQVVIVTDATTNWTATQEFNFWYFKNLYEKEDPKQKTRDCQFFRYKTNFKHLFEAFKMEKERVEYKQGTEPWYFGWSSCDENIASKLRRHYDRPYFLPRTSELNAVDWIFMGGKGLGAHMHLDNVRLPSWQAQLKGTKEWLLAPPPECLFSCHFFSVVVNPGDIIVLDTNKWFHKTNVLSDDISITIGAEYD